MKTWMALLALASLTACQSVTSRHVDFASGQISDGLQYAVPKALVTVELVASGLEDGRCGERGERRSADELTAVERVHGDAHTATNRRSMRMPVLLLVDWQKVVMHRKAQQGE